MVVPKGAQRQEDAADWMNFVYDPENAARITEWVGYISPVKGVREVLEAAGGDSAAVAEEPLVFPDDDTLSASACLRPARAEGRDRDPDPIQRPHGVSFGRYRLHRSPQGQVRALRAAQPGDALAAPLLHRAHGHAAEDRALDQAGPVAAGLQLRLELVELLRLGRPVLRRAHPLLHYAGIATSSASSSATRSPTSSPSRPGSGATCCSASSWSRSSRRSCCGRSRGRRSSARAGRSSGSSTRSTSRASPTRSG